MPHRAPPAAWTPLGRVAPPALAPTRLELHWAVQIIGAVPGALLEPRPDHSHANLEWAPGAGTFLTRPVGDPRVQVGLAVEAFTLVVSDAAGTTLGLPLAGRTLAEAYAWVAGRLRDAGVGSGDPNLLPQPDETFPDHPVRAGASFSGGDAAARAELARWYGNALLALQDVRMDYPSASEVRCWPHHFDLATLLTIEAAEDPERMRSVGVGMTPGDESCGEPYLYVTPWPHPTQPVFPALECGGQWHSEGWVGAVLLGSRLVEGSEAPVQPDRVRAFLRSAVAGAIPMTSG